MGLRSKRSRTRRQPAKRLGPLSLIDTNFEIRAKWPKAPKPGARDIAHLSIHAGDNVLTQLAEVEAGAVRDHLRVSAVTLALWLGDNWWRLRWESLHDNRRPS